MWTINTTTHFPLLVSLDSKLKLPLEKEISEHIVESSLQIAWTVSPD